MISRTMKAKKVTKKSMAATLVVNVKTAALVAAAIIAEIKWLTMLYFAANFAQIKQKILEWSMIA
jgi:hypothetical protein